MMRFSGDVSRKKEGDISQRYTDGSGSLFMSHSLCADRESAMLYGCPREKERMDVQKRKASKPVQGTVKQRPDLMNLLESLANGIDETGLR